MVMVSIFFPSYGEQTEGEVLPLCPTVGLSKSRPTTIHTGRNYNKQLTGAGPRAFLDTSVT